MEKYTVQDYYNFMKFNPDDEDVPQEFLDGYISDVTNTDWFVTHAEMINDFLDNMRMSKLSNIVTEHDCEIDKMASLLKLAKAEDIAFDANAFIRVWVDLTDLEYSTEIENIQKMNIAEDEKIKLAKEFARQVAIDKISTNDVQIRDYNNFEQKLDRIDWVSLVSGEIE